MNRLRPWGRYRALMLLAVAFFPPLSPARADEMADKRIANGSTVTLEYILLLKDGTTVASNLGREPLVYQQGEHQLLLPALETALLGLRTNEITTVTLSPDQAYGAVDPSAFVEVPTASVPEEARTLGRLLATVDPEGNRILLRVHEIHEDRIMLDRNHPLAGQAVTFRVRILSVE